MRKGRGRHGQHRDAWNECFYKGWETSDEYLSGNLIHKLKSARAANKEYNGYFEELKIIKPKGGGGTSFQIIFDYVFRKMPEITSRHPACIVILTDGYAPFPSEKEARGIPVLWLLNNEDVTPPWGKIAKIVV